MRWWQRFKARHIVADDPYDIALEVAAAREYARTLRAQRLVKRILPSTFRRPNGEWAHGCTVFAQNDAARAELLYCVDCLPPTQVTP